MCLLNQKNESQLLFIIYGYNSIRKLLMFSKTGGDERERQQVIPERSQKSEVAKRKTSFCVDQRRLAVALSNKAFLAHILTTTAAFSLKLFASRFLFIPKTFFFNGDRCYEIFCTFSHSYFLLKVQFGVLRSGRYLSKFSGGARSVWHKRQRPSELWQRYCKRGRFRLSTASSRRSEHLCPSHVALRLLLHGRNGLSSDI